MTSPTRIVRDLVGSRERRTFGRCVYCSHPCYGLACEGHRDLLHEDAHYYELRLRTGGAERQEGAHTP